MANQPRRHHYVPQFYLNGFTETVKGRKRLQIVDRDEGKTWSGTPDGAAHVRDFYAVDLGSGCDPMFVEKAMAVCECKWATALSDTMERRAFSDDESFADLLAFVAFLAVRVPRIRNQIIEFVDQTSKAELRSTFATMDGRERFREIVTQYCQTLSEAERRKFELVLRDDPDLKGMAEFVNRGQFDVSYDQTWSVQTMVKMAIGLLPVLGLRQWALWSVAPGEPDLVCSDSPVCLTWSKPIVGALPPGFGHANTTLTVPLNARTALVSTFEEIEPRTLGRGTVAWMNSRTAAYAVQLFSPTFDFVWITDDGEVGNLQDFLKSSIRE